MQRYVEENLSSVFIGTSKSTTEAAKKAPNGYIYVIDNLKGDGTDVNNFYKALGDKNIYENEKEIVFEKIIPTTQIQGAYKIDNKGNPVGDFIPNPNYKPAKKKTK